MLGVIFMLEFYVEGTMMQIFLQKSDVIWNNVSVMPAQKISGKGGVDCSHMNSTEQWEHTSTLILPESSQQMQAIFSLVLNKLHTFG